MNKKELIDSLSHLLSTKQEAKSVVNAIFSAMKKALREGDQITIAELGTFRPYIAHARKGRNPNTGSAIEIPPKKKVRFHQSKELFG